MCTYSSYLSGETATVVHIPLIPEKHTRCYSLLHIPERHTRVLFPVLIYPRGIPGWYSLLISYPRGIPGCYSLFYTYPRGIPGCYSWVITYREAYPGVIPGYIHPERHTRVLFPVIRVLRG